MKVEDMLVYWYASQNVQMTNDMYQDIMENLNMCLSTHHNFMCVYLINKRH